MKKTFQTPKFEIEFFAVQDIITTSDDVVIGPGGLPIVPNSIAEEGAEPFSIID